MKVSLQHEGHDRVLSCTPTDSEFNRLLNIIAKEENLADKYPHLQLVGGYENSNSFSGQRLVAPVQFGVSSKKAHKIDSLVDKDISAIFHYPNFTIGNHSAGGLQNTKLTEIIARVMYRFVRNYLVFSIQNATVAGIAPYSDEKQNGYVGLANIFKDVSGWLKMLSSKENKILFSRNFTVDELTDYLLNYSVDSDPYRLEAMSKNGVLVVDSATYGAINMAQPVTILDTILSPIEKDSNGDLFIYDYKVIRNESVCFAEPQQYAILTHAQNLLLGVGVHKDKLLQPQPTLTIKQNSIFNFQAIVNLNLGIGVADYRYCEAMTNIAL